MSTATHRALFIAAPVSDVFDVVAHIDRFREAVPEIQDFEVLSEVERGPGTRFKETRKVGGREGSAILEVTEYVENEKVRIVSDAGGTFWDTLFTTTGMDDGTQLEMFMEARPHTLAARVSTPLVRGMVVKGIEADLAAVKEYCETA